MRIADVTLSYFKSPSESTRTFFLSSVFNAELRRRMYARTSAKLMPWVTRSSKITSWRAKYDSFVSSLRWDRPKIAFSNFSNRFSSVVFPHTPPKVVTRSFTPSIEGTFNFSGDSRTTFWKADPRHCKAALGANWFNWSAGQIPARNSRRREYSERSVSPGSKLGIKCHGKDDVGLYPDCVSEDSLCSGMICLSTALDLLLSRTKQENHWHKHKKFAVGHNVQEPQSRAR